MNSLEYEKYQLELIEQSYRERGFEVRYEADIGGRSYRFDAIAENLLGEIVIIELVNARRSDEAIRNRLEALKEVSARLPRAKVDFRYIDVDPGTLRMARRRPQEGDSTDLQKALKARLPRVKAASIDATRPFLELWRMQVTTVRAYKVKLGWEHMRTESVLDLYNEMLRTGRLVAPEAVASDVNMDLFDLYAEARGAIEGALIDRGSFEQLRGHVLEIRRQLRIYLRQ